MLHLFDAHPTTWASTVLPVDSHFLCLLEGPYQMFAGRDASRAFATLNLSKDDLRESWDDLSDLSKGEQSTLKEWEEKYVMKYKKIGELLKDRDKKND